MSNQDIIWVKFKNEMGIASEQSVVNNIRS